MSILATSRAAWSQARHMGLAVRVPTASPVRPNVGTGVRGLRDAEAIVGGAHSNREADEPLARPGAGPRSVQAFRPDCIPGKNSHRIFCEHQP